MPKLSIQINEQAIVERDSFQQLLDCLRKGGYRVIGPTVRDKAIVYDELASVGDLPIGWGDEQGPATYRLRRRNDEALFGYVVGPQSWKKYLFPPETTLWTAKRSGGSFQVIPKESEHPRQAFIGVRPCELNAIFIQDKVFTQGEYSDPFYKSLRENIFILAVNCTEPGGTCFCSSMKTGPRAESGFDLAMTEIVDKKRHYFMVQVGSESGAEILSQIPHSKPQDEEKAAVEEVMTRAARKMGRSLDTTGIKELLQSNFEHPRWGDVASRCLTCANCTIVCPTCFCSNVEDVTDLKGETAERRRKWDSCFTIDYSYIHGGSIRTSVLSRYRQWMTHKLASWIDQFGVSGCVGCGRCITWCPVGIDITEEARAIREGTSAGAAAKTHKEKVHGNH